MSVNNGLGSASGYGSIYDTPLARKGYHSQIIAKGWERDIIGEIVNTKVVAQAFNCNDVVEFIIAPEVGPWRKLEDNQAIKADQVSLTSVQMTLCNQAYKALKFDNKFKKNLCDFWSDFEQSFLDSAYRQLSTMWHQFIFSAMVIEASARNKGANAGRNRDINLGSVGKPVRITGQNVAKEIQKLRLVLTHQYAWKDNEMFLVVPPELEAVLIDSPYANAADIGCCKEPSLLLDGEMPGKLVGFRTLKTMRVPGGYDEVANAQAYYVLAFRKDAYAFYGDITEGRIIEDLLYFGFQYQMAALWGGKAIQNEFIAVGYWTFG